MGSDLSARVTLTYFRTAVRSGTAVSGIRFSSSQWVFCCCYLERVSVSDRLHLLPTNRPDVVDPKRLVLATNGDAYLASPISRYEPRTVIVLY